MSFSAAVPPGKRHRSGQHVVEGAAQAVDVGTRVGRVAVLGLFRGHIVHRAHRHPLVGEGVAIGRVGGVLDACQPHVEHLHGALGVDQDVGGLDVAVHDGALACVLQAPSDLAAHLGRASRGQLALSVDEPQQVLPLDVLQGQVGDALFFAHVEGSHDVRVVELGAGAHLAHEPGPGLWVGAVPRGQDFERHGAFHATVLGLVDLAHAAGADAVQNRVRPDEEPLRTTRQNQTRLELRQQPLAHQLLGQRLVVFRGGAGPLFDLLERCLVQQAAGPQVFYKRAGAWGDHCGLCPVRRRTPRTLPSLPARHPGDKLLCRCQCADLWPSGS